jgi:hypothetical protein
MLGGIVVETTKLTVSNGKSFRGKAAYQTKAPNKGTFHNHAVALHNLLGRAAVPWLVSQVDRGLVVRERVD